MSSTPFVPSRGPIIVRGRAIGPLRSREIRLAIDTGATTSLIHRPLLIDLGVDIDRDGRPVQMISASPVELATKVPLRMLSILGQNRVGFPVVAHDLPDGAPIDVLLGLDVFRGQVLTLDFRAGSITLA